MISDDDLLDALRGVLDTAEPVPPVSTTMARAALGWRTVDAELALLVHDSAVDADAMLVRGGASATRLLSFTTGDVHIDVEQIGRRIVGQVSPPGDALIELYDGSGTSLGSADTDEFGAFVISDVPSGPVSMVCRATDGTWSVRTSHITL